MHHSIHRPWYVRLLPWFTPLRYRAAARRNHSPGPVRLLVAELERREVASETLSFLAGGLASFDGARAADESPAAVTRVEQPATDEAFARFAHTLDVPAAPQPAKSETPSPKETAPAVWSGWWKSFGDDGADDAAQPDAPPKSAAPQPDAPPNGGGGGPQARFEQPLVVAAGSPGAAPVNSSPPVDSSVAPIAGSRTSSAVPSAAPLARTMSFSSPTFTPAANPFARGAANVWVLDTDNAITVLPGVTQHAFSEWDASLKAQAIGKEVANYSWDVNNTDAPDATAVAGDATDHLTFTWDTFTGATRTDTIHLTTTFTDTTTDVQSFTFVVNATDSPAWDTQPTFTWPEAPSPDQMFGESSVSVGGGIAVGLSSGAVTASHALPSYNPDVPALSLLYNSTTADNKPVFVVHYTLPEGQPVPAVLAATLTLNSGSPTTGFFDTSAANPGDVLQFAAQADATALATGRYDYEIDVADPNAVGSDPYAQSFPGSVDLINSGSSPLGAGWTLSGLQRIWPTGLGVIIESPGGTSTYRAIIGPAAFADFSSFSLILGDHYTRTYPDGTAITFNWDGLQTAVTDPNGNTTTYTYNGSDQLTTITDQYGQDTTLSYSSGLLTSIVDPAGAETDFGYTSTTLTSITDADGAEWDYGYDGASKLTGVTDPNSNTTGVNYGTFDRAGSVDAADGTTRGFTPLVTQGLGGSSGSPAGAVLAVAAYGEFDDGNGSPWVTQADWAGFGSTTQAFAPDGGVSLAYRDENDLAWLSADPLARRTRTFFDGPNTTKAVAPDDTFIEAPTYNDFGEPDSVTDANGHVTNYTYDDFGNLLATTDADGVTVSHTYDPFGHAVSTTTALDAATPFDEHAVNTTTSGDQTAPAIAANADGDSVAVWVSADASGSGIFARRIHPDGSPAGSQFQVNTVTSGDQISPAVAVAADGSFTVVWAGPDGWNNGIFARRFHADGTYIDAADFQVSTTWVGPQSSPQVGYAADGSFVVAWANEWQGTAAAQLYAADGTPDAGGELALSTTSGAAYVDTRLAVAADGSFAVGWLDTDNATYNDFVVRKFDSTGSATTGDLTAYSVPTYGATWIAADGLALAADGSLLATWETADTWGTGIFGKVYDSGGTGGSAFTVPSYTAADQTYESSAALPGGGWAVAWQDEALDGSGWGIFARRLKADGTADGSEFLVNQTTAGDQQAVSVAAAPGGFAGAWTGPDASGTGIFARRWLFNAESRSTYDATGHLTRSIDPLGNATLYGYDAAGNQTSVTDPLGHESTATYDEMHRPLTQVDALTGETDYDYDPAGNLYTLTDPDANVTTYTTRDGLNRVLTETDPNSNDTTYAYDGNGNLLSTTDRDGRVRTFDYDLNDRRLDEVWWSGLSDVYEADYTYDLAGQLLTASDDNSSYSYTYDLLGRVTEDDGAFGPVTVDLAYGHDDAGNRTSVDDGTAAVNSTYTDGNRLDTLGMTVSSTLGANVTFSYDLAGRLSGLSRMEGASGSTVDTAYGFDGANRLTDILHTSSYTAGTLSEFAYAYDAASRLTTYSGPEGDRTYGYDDTDQLTSVTDPIGPTTLESFTYDPNGNRLTSGATSYGTPDPGNRMTSDGTYTYTYDDNGNTTVKSKSGERWEYTYDYRNRLTDVKKLTGLGGTVLYDAQYTYDVFDRRIGVNEDADGSGGGAAVQTWYAYDGANTWADFDGSGTLTMRYLNGPGMDERYARVTAGGTVGWYMTDNLGSVRQIVATNGTVGYAVVYTAFGTIASQSGGGGDRFKYTGREWDGGTVDYFYRARYYDSNGGRFASADPKGFVPGDSNLSRYARNSPSTNTDPTGMWSEIGADGGAAAGGAVGGTIGFAVGGGVAIITGEVIFLPMGFWCCATFGGGVGYVLGGVIADPASPPAQQKHDGELWGATGVATIIGGPLPALITYLIWK